MLRYQCRRSNSAEVREELNKNSAKGYVAPGKEPVSVTYDCNSYS